MCVPADGAVRYLPYEQRSLQSRDSKRGRKTGGGAEGREKKGERRKERRSKEERGGWGEAKGERRAWRLLPVLRRARGRGGEEPRGGKRMTPANSANSGRGG